jgi:hypothetical protein
MHFNLFTIIILSIISYIADVKTGKDIYQNCIGDNSIKLELLIHHFINVFAQFGWLIDNKYILYCYIVLPVILMIHWKSNNDKCAVSQDINRKCNIPNNPPLRDLWYFIGLKDVKYYSYIQKTYLLSVWLYAIYKLKYKF